jgi:perosamine synthetase
LKAPLIPWARPHLFGGEADAMREALLSTWISGGPFVDQFEESIRNFAGTRFACAASNGTAAIHLAYLALGIGAGDEVVVPGFAYLGAANVALLCGARPVFAEVDPATWCLTADAVARVLTPRTKAVMAIHTYGNMCDMDSLKALLSASNVPVIEDAAEAFGSSYKGQLAGAGSMLGIYSFHATKTITTGEGGMVVTDNEKLFERIQLYRSHGMARNVRYYWHEVAGHNFRLTNFQAAMGCAQFAHFAEVIESRAALHHQYRQRLQTKEGITLQTFERTVTPVLWALAVRLDPTVFSQGRDEVILQMRDRGIECRPGFYAASQQRLYNAPALPVCEGLARQVLSLPCYIGLEEEQVDYICQTLIDLRQHHSNRVMSAQSCEPAIF